MKRQHRFVTILVLSLVVLAVSGTVFLSFAMGDETDIVTIDISQTKSYYKVGDATLGTGQIQVNGVCGNESVIPLTGSADVTYSFSNTDALTVTGTGIITAQAAGGGVLTVTYTKADNTTLSAKMYIGAHTGASKIADVTSTFPADVAGKVEKITTIKRSGDYAVKLTNNGQWPSYAPIFDSSVSEIWFYDDGTSADSFFAYFQSTGNDATYTPRKDDPSTGQYFIGYDNSVSNNKYYYRSSASGRTKEKTGSQDTDMAVGNTVTTVERKKGWHQVTLIANAGQAAYDKNGTVSIYLDGELIFTENYTHRFMGVLRPQGAGTKGGIFDDLIWYTNGNNIPQTAPVAQNVTVSGIFEEGYVLTGSYKYYDVNGDYEKPVAGTSTPASPTFWQVSDNGVDNWTNLCEPGQGNNTYTITANEAGKYIRFGVIPTSSDQNYGVANTARVGEAAYSQVKQVAGQRSVFTQLDISETNNMLFITSGMSSNIILYGYDANHVKTNITNRGIASYQSSNTNVAVVDASGKITPVATGTAIIRATVDNGSSGVERTQLFVVVAHNVQDNGYEFDPLSSSDQKRQGMKSLCLTGTANKDYYCRDYPSNGVLEAWFYDDGNTQNTEVYFQTGTKEGTIPATARYHVGLSMSASTSHYYVKNNRGDRPSPAATETRVTQVPRSVGWHQVIVEYKKGEQINDTTGSVNIYLDCNLILTENYSHDNMQVIRASVQNNSNNAYFDDFRFYDFDNIAFTPPSGSTTFDGEIADVELHINSSAVAASYLLTYSSDDFELYDFCGGAMEKEIKTGSIPGTGITINQVEGEMQPVIVKFSVSPNYAGTIRLKAKKELSQTTMPTLSTVW